MQSHTVPRKLLEHFAYDDPVTRSKRLWRYQKGKPPYGRATPTSATRWDRHFADPANAAKEAEIETRLQREFEDPVNQFIDLLHHQTFPFDATHKRLLMGYINTLFHRSVARRAASGGQTNQMIDMLRAIRADDDMLGQYVGKITMDLVRAGFPRMATKEEAREAIDHQIAELSRPDAAQCAYVQMIETMMNFKDEGMRNGDWSIIRSDPDKPFVIGDAPVVTWERIDQNTLLYGQGFARPNVEVLLPVFPTACLHVLPAVKRNRRVRTPSTEEVNMAQAAFASQYCFTNVRSTDIDGLLQPHSGTVRLGIDGFSTKHLDHKKNFFEILMNQQPFRGRIAE